ncbi:hypothetical protein ACTPDI_16765 [Clostridioides difficile]
MEGRRINKNKSIVNAYGKFIIANDYVDKCRNYIVSFRVSLGLADIECTDVKVIYWVNIV